MQERPWKPSQQIPPAAFSPDGGKPAYHICWGLTKPADQPKTGLVFVKRVFVVISGPFYGEGPDLDLRIEELR